MQIITDSVRRRDPRKSWPAWLYTQRHRCDAVGALARDYFADGRAPGDDDDWAVAERLFEIDPAVAVVGAASLEWQRSKTRTAGTTAS